MGGTHGSGIVSSAADIIWMSVVLGVFEMCMYLAWGGMGSKGSEWMRPLGLGFNNPVGTGGSVGRLSVFELWWCR